MSPPRGGRGESGSAESIQDEMDSPDGEVGEQEEGQSMMQGIDVRRKVGAVGRQQLEECPEPVQE